MNNMNNTWALVLAAGEGTRLNSLTTDAHGRCIPKQFCSLNGGASLLQETLDRAEAVVRSSRIAAVVAHQHRAYWEPILSHLPVANRIEQPRNRGTANGILLPLLHILDRDPNAVLVILPSDHYVSDEGPLRRTIARGVRQVREGLAEIVLLGIVPDRIDPELGYIVPVLNEGQPVRAVQRFVEKPQPELASELLQAGALWNSFIMVLDGQALLNLYVSRFPEVVRAMVEAMTSPPAERAAALASLYDELPDIDFSRHLLSGAERVLSVLPVPRCGWSDLGTPRRVGEAVERLGPRVATGMTRTGQAFLNLASAHFSLQSAG